MNRHHPGRDRPPSQALAGPILTAGFATAVAIWLLWLLTNLPGLRLPPAASGPLLLVALGAGCIGAGRYGPRGWVMGLGAGLAAGLLDLLVLGSLVAGTPTVPGGRLADLTPHAALWASGWIALCAAIGAGAGALGGRHPAPDRARNWLARFGVVTCFATAPLLVLGGAVTSTDSGLAVPDWPGTYGANMFLYPIGLMTDHRIFLEHSHRLFGALVGLTTIVFAAQVILARRNSWLSAWAGGLVLLVIAQGVAGGLRVREASPIYGLLHGITAQVFLGLLAALVATIAGAPGPSALTRRLASLLAGALLIQLSLGATYRHLSHAPEPVPGVIHILWTHIAFAFAVVAIAMATGARLRRSPDTPSLRAGSSAAPPPQPPPQAGHKANRRLGSAIIHSISAQLLLGVGALIAVMLAPGGPTPTSATAAAAEPAPAVAAIITVAHQANGALLLALAAVALAWSWRHSRQIAS